MKVGILTHYYKTNNYGGSLQAYALAAVLNKLGYDSEQICYDIFSENGSILDLKSFSKLPLEDKLDRVNVSFSTVLNNIVSPKQVKDKLRDEMQKRRSAFSSFTENITKHSDNVYNDDNISNSVSLYDAFITGSDQVWNPLWYKKPFFLDFVPSEKIKISYAASIGRNSLDKRMLDIIKNSLKDFKAVSVREKSAVDLIKNQSPVEVVQTLDPTLLLEREDWDNIAEDRKVKEDYVFTYFLGRSKKQRAVAKQYAKDNNLKLVNIPFLHMRYAKCDDNYPDIDLYDVSPIGFISLIKHAKCIFTDSFHATVFSCIYKKQFFTFERENAKSMSSRLYTLLSFYKAEHRFLDKEEKHEKEYINSLKEADYSYIPEELNRLKEKSISFLTTNLKEN